jgi:hypothetical protein
MKNSNSLSHVGIFFGATERGLRNGKGTYLQAVHPVRTFGLLARRFFTSGVAPSIPATTACSKAQAHKCLQPNPAVAGYAATSALKMDVGVVGGVSVLGII